MAESALVTDVKRVFQRALSIAPDDLHPDTRRGGLEQWDSLGHLNLLDALRTALGVDIPPEQALEMETFEDVVRIVSELRSAQKR